MRITKHVQQTVLETEDIICNKCNKSCRVPHGGPNSFGGLIEIETSGEYGSEIIGDGCHHSFSLCETCFMELSKTFIIPSFQWDDLAPYPLEEEEKVLAVDNEGNIIGAQG